MWWRKSRLLLLISVAALISSCTGIGDDPAELLSQAVSSVMAEDNLDFEGTSSMRVSDIQLEKDYQFIGQVRGHNEIFIQPNTDLRSNSSALHHMNSVIHYAKVNKRWTMAEGEMDEKLNPLFTVNPLIHAEHLNRAMKDVKVEESMTSDGMTILVATIKEDRLTEQYKRQIRSEHEALIQSAIADARLADNKEFEDELMSYAEQTRQQLTEILDTLAIQFDYRLKVNRKNRSMHEMDVVAGLHYNTEGNRKVEAIRTSYRFQH